MKSSLPLLFIFSIVSTGVAFFKIYPIVFSIFIFACLVSRIKIEKILVATVSLFIFFATIFALINIGKSFDLTSYVKLVLNFTFFVFAATYLTQLPTVRAISLFRLTALIFLFISFLQILFIVANYSLWSLPFNLQDSSASYVVGEKFIIFGDINKNIWAAKVSIFFIVFCCCQYINKRHGILYSSIPFMAIFTLMYVNSRTAQLTFIGFIAALLYYHYWFNKRQKAVFFFLNILAVPLLLYIVQFVVRVDFDILIRFNPEIEGHMGDGLLARFIIWHTVFASIDFSDVLIGNGVLSFSYYTGGIFGENNPHNIFLSILLDFGLLTFALYIFILRIIFWGNSFSKIMLIPFFVFANSQYLGYDTDLMVYFILVFFIGSNELLNRN